MKAMNVLPGFIAESSLYKTIGRYQLASTTQRGELNASMVQPSLAIYQDGRFVCNGEITESGYINCYPIGGGGGPFCRPSCGRCESDPESRTGRSRTCIKRNCDDVVRPC